MQFYLVGGAVRDLLLGIGSTDRDWLVVGATPEQLIAQGYTPVGRNFPVFLHPKTKEEYALARVEKKTGLGYTGFACFFDPSVTLEEDLLRRDLTINAMAQDETGNVYDPYGGQLDLQAKVLRHVSQAFVDDPLRVLRVARFAAKFHDLGFSIATQTMKLMKNISQSGELKILTAERVWTEWHKALLTTRPDMFLTVLDLCSALPEILPEIKLSKQLLSIAKRVSLYSKLAVIKFAVQLSCIDTQEILALTKRLNVPKEYSQLALLLNKHLRDFYNIQSLSAQRIVNLYNQIDVWRKPDHLSLLIICVQAIYDDELIEQEQLLRAVYHAMLAVNVQSIIQAGYKGCEIKIQLEKERIAQVQEILIKLH